MKGLPKRGERTAKHIAAEKKMMAAAGKQKQMTAVLPPMYGGKQATKKAKK